jgi:hypothetical protein
MAAMTAQNHTTGQGIKYAVSYRSLKKNCLPIKSCIAEEKMIICYWLSLVYSNIISLSYIQLIQMNCDGGTEQVRHI